MLTLNFFPDLIISLRVSVYNFRATRVTPELNLGQENKSHHQSEMAASL